MAQKKNDKANTVAIPITNVYSTACCDNELRTMTL